jgi:uncharacterized protein (TIRG00374 family)
MNRKRLLNILKIIVSVGLLTYIFSSLDLWALVTVLSGAHPIWLIAALMMMFLGVIIRALRWQILLKAIGAPVPLAELTAIYLIGFLFNNLLPSGLGGDAMRMVELNRHTQRGSDTVTSVVVDRFLGISALQAIALVALLTNWGAVPAGIAYFTIAIFLGGLVIGYLLLNRSLYFKLRQRLKLFQQITNIKFINNMFESFQRYPLPALGRAYLVSILFNLTLILMYALIGTSLEAPVTLAQYAVIVPITSLLLLIPLSIAGLGIREASFQEFYGPLGVLPEVAVAMSLLVHLIGNICTGLVGGVIYLLRSTRSVVSENR